MQTSAKKLSNFWSFLFFKLAKRFARNAFAAYYPTKILQGNNEDVNPPAMLHGSVLWSTVKSTVKNRILPNNLDTFYCTTVHRRSVL